MKRIVKPAATKQEDVDKFLKYKFNITSFLFPQQLAFVEDPAPFKVAVCSRRSGKTTACAAHLVHSAINNPGSNNLYITVSGTDGMRIIWKEFLNILGQFKVEHSASATEGSITFPNKSTIYVLGAKDAGSINKIRGIAIKLCYIDESQNFREYIQDLIDDVIAPALIDYAGSLCLIGTPGSVPTGFFYDCATTSQAWSKHSWTFWDNPHIPLKSGMTHKQVLDRELLRRGVTVDSPSIQREFFGKWVLDTDSLILHYLETKNNYDGLPLGKLNYVLGVDIGFKDADALAVLGWSDSSPDTYLIEEIITAKQGITELVEQINSLRKKYDISKIVMDMGGLGKKIGEEMARRYLLPVEAAEKSRKMENIEILDDALRTGRFKAKPKSRFVTDTYLVEVDRDKSRPDRKVISDRYHSDIIDAVLYAFKFSPAYTYEPPKSAPKRGTKEWADQQANDMFEAELEGLMKEQAYSKWIKGEFE